MTTFTAKEAFIDLTFVKFLSYVLMILDIHGDGKVDARM